MPKEKGSGGLTTPDLVLLSLLAERPMHGYEANQELQRRQVEDWAGRTALANALERADWTTQRERPPFLTWIALSWQARPGVFENQIRRRQKFLEEALAREEETLRAIKKEVGHRFHEAVWMVSLVIDQFRTELRWLRKLQGELKHRGPARHV